MPIDTNQGGPAGPDLSKASLDDLIHELKTRCLAVAVVLVVEDENGDDISKTKYLGSRLLLLGAIRDLDYTLTHNGYGDCQ